MTVEIGSGYVVVPDKPIDDETPATTGRVIVGAALEVAVGQELTAGGVVVGVVTGFDVVTTIVYDSARLDDDG